MSRFADLCRSMIVGVALLRAVAIGSPAVGVEVTFDNDNLNGVWEEVDNWDTGSVPGFDDQALIDGGFSVTTASDVTIFALRLGTGGSGGNLTVAGASTFITGGLVNVAEAQDTIGTLTITGAGTTTSVGGNLSLANGANSSATVSMTDQAAVTLGGNFRLANGANSTATVSITD